MRKREKEKGESEGVGGEKERRIERETERGESENIVLSVT